MEKPQAFLAKSLVRGHIVMVRYTEYNSGIVIIISS